MAESINTNTLPALNITNRPDGRLRIPPTVGNPTQEQIRTLALQEEASRQRREEEERRRYYANTSQNSPLNLAIAAQNKAAASPFIPTTPDEKAAYSLALKNQTSFASPAAAYMRERQLEREQAARGLLNEMSPARVTNKALRDGNDAGESKLLERMARSGLLSTLQGMARAERMYGVGPLAAFSESALDVQAARSAAAQQQREMGLELAKERIKAGDGGDAIRKMLAKGETQKLLSTAGNTFKMINASEKIRKILGTKGASGLANAAKTWATQFGNIFGFNLEATSRQEVEDIIGTLEQQIAGARIFGRDLSRFDYEVLAKVLKSPGIVESDKRIRNQYKRLINDLERTHAQSVKSLNILIGRDTTQQLLRQSNVTGDLFRNYNQGK